MDNASEYRVTNLAIRQTPLLSPSGQIQATTTATFMIGVHGPFTLSWPGANPGAADIAAAIQQKVAELKSVGQAVQQINSRP